MRVLMLVALFALSSGCAALETPPEVAPDAPAAPQLAFLPPVPVSMDYPGAEPVIAVAADGTIYIEGIGAGENGNENKVSRSDDGGVTWRDITPPAFGQEQSNDGFVAVAPDGTVYAANVFSLTFQVFRSDDKGATWTPLNMPRLPGLMHRHWIAPVEGDIVHVAVEALPPSFVPYLVGGPTPDEIMGTPNEGMWYFRSDDRGATWSIPQQIDPVVNFAGQGNMVVSADGQRLFIPRYEEDGTPFSYTYDDGHWYMLVSADGGSTWDRVEMFDLTAELSTAVPSLALDPAGVLYFAWSMEQGGSSRVHMATSRDAAATWTSPRDLQLGNGTHAMVWLDARGAGDIGLMWHTAEVEGTASQVDAEWFVDYASITGADGDTPTIRTTRVTPLAMHHGNICAKGPACEGAEDRSLLDYPWLDFGPDGKAHMVFASTEWERSSAFAVFAREA